MTNFDESRHPRSRGDGRFTIPASGTMDDDLPGDLSHRYIAGATMAGATLDDVDADSVTFQGADFTGATLSASPREAVR